MLRGGTLSSRLSYESEDRIRRALLLRFPAGLPLKFPRRLCGTLLSMTRNPKSPVKQAKPRRRTRTPNFDHWLLRDAKARFGELVRRVRSEGPQRVTIHGRDEVVVISAEEFRRLKGDLTGESLIAAMQALPYRDVDIEPGRASMRLREIAW